MKKINLRELYPDVYTTDFFVDVTEEVMEIIRAAERAEAAYERKMYRYKAQQSLDCGNGIENAVLLKPQTPEIELEGYQAKLKEVDLNKTRLEREIDSLPADVVIIKLCKLVNVFPHFFI